MNSNIIRFYIIATKLKEKLRTGFVEIGINKKRTESVAEHIYGTLIIAISIISEYKLDLNMETILKMLTLHELEETLMPDFTVRSNITKKEKIELGRNCVHIATMGLINQEEFEKLLNEFNDKTTKEAQFCQLVDKIECDFQAKIYDLENVMDYDKTSEDLKYYGEHADLIASKAKTASDFWIEYDKPLYKDNYIFESLIEDIQKITEKKYLEIMNLKGED